MFLLLDSNFRNALAYGGRQLGLVFSESVQRNARSCSDRAATIHQITTCLRPLPSDQRSFLVFGGFENFATGLRSTIQPEPMTELKNEMADYVQMIRDVLGIYPHVTIYILPPLFRAQPIWYARSYVDLLPLFLSEVSHVDPARVMVVPPITVTGLDLDCDGVHLGSPALQRLLDVLLRTFRDGVFIKPADYPVPDPNQEAETIGELLFPCHCRCAIQAIRTRPAHLWVPTPAVGWMLLTYLS